MLGVHFAAHDRGAVDALHAKAKAFGVNVTIAPAELPRSAGGGYGFQFQHARGPRAQHRRRRGARTRTSVNDRSKPMKLSHVVLNSAKIGDADRLLHRLARLPAVRHAPT